MTYRHAAHTAWQVIDDETIILNLKQRKMFGFNKLGGIIWQVLVDGVDVKELKNRLHGSKKSALAESIMAFVNKLIDLDLICPSDSHDRDTDSPNPTQFPSHLEAPAILWQEPMLESVGQSCAFTTFQSYICHQAPFS